MGQRQQPYLRFCLAMTFAAAAVLVVGASLSRRRRPSSWRGRRRSCSTCRRCRACRSRAAGAQCPVRAATCLFLISRRSSGGGAAGTSRLPCTATALSFFEPITAPSPERAAARPLLFITEAMRATFSPAGPMQATCRSLPCSALRMSWVSKVSLPQMPAASLQLGLAVVDVEVHRLLRDAREEHRVVAGELEVGPEVPARVGVSPAPRRAATCRRPRTSSPRPRRCRSGAR